MADNGGPQITEVIWESIREPFTKHYLYEHRTFKYAMDIMKRDPNFPVNTTGRMFKTRIHHWELDAKTIKNPL